VPFWADLPLWHKETAGAKGSPGLFSTVRINWYAPWIFSFGAAPQAGKPLHPLRCKALYNTLPMDRFVISDESVNCYGTRVLTSGIDVAGFLKNPIMLYMHDRYRYLPIGHWEEVRKEGGKLTGVPVFDEADDFAKTIKGKVEAGTLKACSPGLSVVEWSEDRALLVQGQTRPTVTKSTLLEVSIVDIPANKNALKLAAPQLHLPAGLTLSAGAEGVNLDNVLPTLKLARNMDEIILALGLPAGATEKDIAAAILKLKQDAAAEQTALVLKLAKAAGLVTADNEAKFLKLATVDVDLALEFYGKPAEAPAPAAPQEKALRLSEVVREVTQANAQAAGVVSLADKRKDWTIDDWSKKDSAGLIRLKREQPDKYQQLYNDYYGGKL
jgi:hypothetical protein